MRVGEGARQREVVMDRSRMRKASTKGDVGGERRGRVMQGL